MRTQHRSGPVLRHRGAGLALLGIAIVVLTVVSACLGTRDIALATTWQALTDFDPTNSEHLLVRHQRLPRALLGALVGACLGVAGAIMQALTRNPLAEPGLLGVNAGAAFLIACAIAFVGVGSVSEYLGFGLVGAAMAAALVFGLGGRGGTNPVRLVLAGASVSVVLSAATQLVLLNSSEQTFDRYRHWMVGSLAGRGWDTLAVILVPVLLGLLIAAVMAKSLDAVVLGEDLGRSLGARPGLTWSFAGLAVIVLAGTATAAAGPITFLGLATPHLARILVGVSHKWVLPYAALLSAALILAADTLGRVLPERGEISVGIMAALIGGPFFVLMARRRKLVRL